MVSSSYLFKLSGKAALKDKCVRLLQGVTRYTRLGDQVYKCLVYLQFI